MLFDAETIGTGPFDFRYDLQAGGARVWADGTGIERVLVNGVTAMVGGKETGEFGGEVLRSGRDTHTVTNADLN